MKRIAKRAPACIDVLLPDRWSVARDSRGEGRLEILEGSVHQRQTDGINQFETVWRGAADQQVAGLRHQHRHTVSVSQVTAVFLIVKLTGVAARVRSGWTIRREATLTSQPVCNAFLIAGFYFVPALKNGASRTARLVLPSDCATPRETRLNHRINSALWCYRLSQEARPTLRWRGALSAEAHQMTGGYTRDDLIKHACVGSDLLTLWEEAGVFQVHEKGQYDLHHVVQAVVCDRLYRLGLKALTLRAACRALDVSWQSGAAVQFSSGYTNLWVSFSHAQVGHYGPRIEAERWLDRAEPLARVVNDVELLSEIRHVGRFGIVINLTHIVRDVEERTGDKFIL